MDFVVAHKTEVIVLCQSGQESAETIEHEVVLAGQLVEILTGRAHSLMVSMSIRRSFAFD